MNAETLKKTLTFAKNIGDIEGVFTKSPDSNPTNLRVTNPRFPPFVELNYRDFRLLWTGQSSSQAGSPIQVFAKNPKNRVESPLLI